MKLVVLRGVAHRTCGCSSFQVCISYAEFTQGSMNGKELGPHGAGTVNLVVVMMLLFGCI